MLSNKPYTTPVTDVFMLSPKDRMMQDLANTGGDAEPAPVRFPEDN